MPKPVQNDLAKFNSEEDAKMKRKRHIWTGPTEVVRWPHCTVCFVIRRKDGRNKPCRGFVPIAMRATAEERILSSDETREVIKRALKEYHLTENRRLRRVIARIGYIVAMPKRPEPNVCGDCGDSFCTDTDREDVGFCNGCAQEMVEQVAGMVEAALAPRRRTK